MSKKLSVSSLREMVKKALITEKSAPPNPFPKPSNPVQASTDNSGLLAKAQKSLADNEALRAEIKGELEANPANARILKMALQDVTRAILANKEVIASLAKKTTGGQLNEGFDSESGKVEEFWLTLENDGQVSDPAQRASNSLGRRYDAVLNALKKHAAKGRYDRGAAIKGWMYFVDDYAKQYAEDFLELYGRHPSKSWISKPERLEIASRLEEKERNNVTGEGEWEQPSGKDFSSDVTFEEQAYAAPSVATEQLSLAVDPNAAALKSRLNKLVREFPGLTWKPNEQNNGINVLKNRLFVAGITRENSRWVVDYGDSYEGGSKLIVRDLNGVEELVREAIADFDIPTEVGGEPIVGELEENSFLPDISEPEEYEHPLDRVRDQEQIAGLDADDMSDIEWDDQDWAYGDESHWDDVLPDVPSEGPGWTLSPDKDQSWIPDSEEDTSLANDTVPEPGQEFPKQMGMGKAASLRKEEVPGGAGGGVVDEEFSMKAHVNDPATIAEKVEEALGWVSNDDPNKVSTFGHWVRREAREAQGRGGMMDDEQYAEIAEEFISDMTDQNEEYSMMDTSDQEAAGMTRVEAYPFTLMDKVALGKAIVEKLT